IGIAGRAAYHASKHGVIGLTKSAALEYASRGIRINAVCPGTINTPMVADMLAKEPDAMKDILRDQPIGRLGQPEEIAAAVLWLLPLTLTMNDLFRREKFAHLPRAISEEGKRTHSYEVGQVVYWSPGPDLAIFYRNDGEKIPNPGIIVIGKIDSGVAALDIAGSVKVTIELHDKQ